MVDAGECVVLAARSLRQRQINPAALAVRQLPDEGRIRIKHGDEWVDLVAASPQSGDVETTVGWVSRVLARRPVFQHWRCSRCSIPAFRVKPAPLEPRCAPHPLEHPERLAPGASTTLSPVANSQLVDIARGFIVDYPILLLDEPTASLDAKNSAAVVELIREAKTRGAAIVGIFHSEAIVMTSL